MASSPTPDPQAGAPQGAPGGGSATPQPAVLQLVAVITRASDALAKSFPAASPMVEEIQNQLRMVQAKMSETMTPSQPQAPPI